MPALEARSFNSIQAQKLFSDYEVTEEDLLYYRSLIESGKEDQAIEEFLAKYVTPFVTKYQSTMQNYLAIAESGQLKKQDQDSMERSVAIITSAILALLLSNFQKFTDHSIAIVVFEETKIKSAKLRKAILDQTLAQFKSLTEKSMLETQTNVLSYIRTLQKEMIVANQLLAKEDLTNELVSSEIENFRRLLKRKFPDIYKAMEEGKILKSSLLPNGTFKNFKLDSYLEMSVRTTLLNIRNTAIEVDAQLTEADVVEYYQRDFRSVTNERIVCQDILSESINGKSLLALNDNAARILGIMTLAEARSKGAMGPHCRHGIRQVSKSYVDSLGAV